MSSREILQVLPFSDGDITTHPPPPYRRGDDTNYLLKLGQAWKTNPVPGVPYRLAALPDGYAVYDINQPGGPQIYKRLFGHPSGKFYDSILKFLPHFLWLQGGKEGDCECQMCSRKPKPPAIPRPRQTREVIEHVRRPPRRDESGTDDNEISDNVRTFRTRREPKPTGAPMAVDEEGTEDVYKMFIMRLHGAKDSSRGLDEDIEEKSSIDWRAEHESDMLPNRLKELAHQPSFLPRIGEVVLWCQFFLDGHYLVQDRQDGLYKFFSYKLKRFSGTPIWRAGVITATPMVEAGIAQEDFHDILQLLPKQNSLSTAGYRVETLPDPSSTEGKYVSKQYRYIPLQSIRPISQWQSLLRGIPHEELHPSIFNALASSTSFSLLEKFKCTGTWPNGVVHCKAIYLGPELITVGDTVRLLSQSKSTCTEVLKIDSIHLNLDGIKDEHATKDSPLLASRSWVSFIGKAYTTLRQNCHDPEPIEKPEANLVFQPVGALEYGPWYRLHAPLLRYEVSLEQVLGRLHEPIAVRLWKGQVKRRQGGYIDKPDLNYDVQGILASRQYATKMDRRLPDSKGGETRWYWADTRAAALSVESFNDLEVGQYWDVRNKATLRSWQDQIKVLNGVQITPGIDNKFVSLASIGDRRGRKPGGKLVDGKVVYPGDDIYEAHFGGDNSSIADSKPKPSSQMAGAAMASTDEDSDEIEEIDLEVWTKDAPKLELMTGHRAGQYDGLVDSSPDRQAPAAAKMKQPLVKRPQVPMSKAAIMAAEVLPSIEGEETSSEGEFDWDHIPPARGGTEESENGDYDPGME